MAPKTLAPPSAEDSTTTLVTVAKSSYSHLVLVVSTRIDFFFMYFITINSYLVIKAGDYPPAGLNQLTQTYSTDCVS